MKYFLSLACLLLLAHSAHAQDSCPRVWRVGDSLMTDTAAALQWFRNDAPQPGETRTLHHARQRASYAVEATGTPGPVFRLSEGKTFEITGWAFDERRRPVAGAAVVCAGAETTTDAEGWFSLNAPSGQWSDESTPFVLRVSAESYHPRSLRVDPRRSVQVLLRPLPLTNRFDAAKGATMAHEGFTIAFPANGLRRPNGGAAYLGQALLHLEAVRPDAPDFGLRMPGGEFTGLDEDGNWAQLWSYGFFTARVTDTLGAELELARPAEIRFSFPLAELERAPDSVALWHFEEETALWRADGWARREGLTYRGEVSHFSSWNVDWERRRARVRGRLVDCQGAPVAGAWVSVGQRTVWSDSAGRFSCLVPAGVDFEAWTASDTASGHWLAPGVEEDLGYLRTISIDGLAFYEVSSGELTIEARSSYNELLFSVDGGESYGPARSYALPDFSGTWVGVRGGGCEARLRVVRRAAPVDCRLYSVEELLSGDTTLGIVGFGNLEEALEFDGPVHRLSLRGPIAEPADSLRFLLMDRLPCLQRLIINNYNATKMANSSLLLSAVSQLSELKYFYLRDDSHFLTMDASHFNGISLLSNLEVLRLVAIKRINSISPEIWQLYQLRELEISDWPQVSGGADVIPNGLEQLSNLQKLHLSIKGVREFPVSLFQLKKLNYLTLDATDYDFAGDSFDQLTDLFDLHVSESEGHMELPPSLFDLPKLKKLSLAGDIQYQQIGSLLHRLADTLEEFDISGCPNLVPVGFVDAIKLQLPNTIIIWE